MSNSEALREQRLDDLRREAELTGTVQGAGFRPSNAPMPIASPTNGYYQQHHLKQPEWTNLIPFYFFVGGATGAMGVIGSLADLLAGDTELAKRARWMTLGGVGLSSALLIIDLGRPGRFLNMLRVFKPQSTMSMGSWVLSGFGVSASLSSLADALEWLFGRSTLNSVLRGLGRTGCVLFGMPFHNYTGVLIGATCIPVWNNRIRSLPREFGMSGLQAGVSALELTGGTDSVALNVLGIFSAAFETWEGLDLLRTKHRALNPAKKGASGLLLQCAGIVSGPAPIALRVSSMFTKNRKRLRWAAAIAGIAGSILLRYAWVYAGKVSAKDWRVPLEIEDERE